MGNVESRKVWAVGNLLLPGRWGGADYPEKHEQLPLSLCDKWPLCITFSKADRADIRCDGLNVLMHFYLMSKPRCPPLAPVPTQCQQNALG